MRFLRVVAFFMASIMLIGACTNSGDSSAHETPTTSVPKPSALAFVDEDAAALRLALDGDSDDLFGDFDPVSIAMGDQSAVVLADLLYDGLTEAVGRTGQLRPGLALSWSSDQSQRVWTFELDSERVSAAQMKASLERAVAAPTVAGSLLGDVLGVSEYLSGEADSVSGFEVVDDSTLTILLNQPNAGLDWVLSGVAYSAVGVNGQPTGRYDVASKSADGFSLEAADGSVVEVTWTLAGQSGLDVVEGGDIDIAYVAESIGGEPIELRVGDVVPVGSSRFFVLNGESEQLADPLKREAVVVAANRSELAAAAGLDASTDGLSSGALAGFAEGACQWCDVSVERKRDLAQVVPTIERLVIGYVGESQSAATTALAQRLSDVGLAVEVRRFESEDLAAAIGRGSVDLFTFGWTSVSGSTDATVPWLLGSQSSTNVFGVGWAEVDSLLAEAARTDDDVLRWGLLFEAESEALSQFVAVPFGARTSRLAGVQAVAGAVVRADGSLDLDGLR